jgi:preprotein translocase subunit SecG
MGFFKKLIDVFTLGSAHPVRRLIGYYLVLAAVVVPLATFVPTIDRMFGAETAVGLVRLPQTLQDGLGSAPNTQSGDAVAPERLTRLNLAVSTAILILATLALILPVSWVYMSTQKSKRHDQQIAQTLVFLPLVVAGIVLVVQNSLALAFSLAGVVAAVRFRTTLRDARDVVFIFLAIAVGFAAGVQSLVVAAIVSVSFNFLLILTWRYDFGRNVLEPTASAQWAEPLQELAAKGGNGKVPDRDLVMALDQKNAIALSERFNRVRRILGPSGKKPRFNGILTVSTDHLRDAQKRVGEVLDEMAGRWRLDEVVSNVGKPSELYYLVRLRKRTGRDDVLTAVRSQGGGTIVSAEVELGEARQEEDEKERDKKG